MLDYKYNNWNFTNGTLWDSNVKDENGQYTSFWYNINTTILVKTQPYRIGLQQMQSASIRSTPTKDIIRNKYPEFQLLGFIPLSYKTFNISTVTFFKATNINVN